MYRTFGVIYIITEKCIIISKLCWLHKGAVVVCDKIVHLLVMIKITQNNKLRFIFLFLCYEGTQDLHPEEGNSKFWCDFDCASSLICGNKMLSRCNRGSYCRSYCLLNMFREPLCPSSGAQVYYTVVAACGISCCGFQVVVLVWSSETCWASNKICIKNLCCI